MAHCANKWFVNARKICPACSSHKGGGEGPKARQGESDLASSNINFCQKQDFSDLVLAKLFSEFGPLGSSQEV